jgi:hypothetical protein
MAAHDEVCAMSGSAHVSPLAPFRVTERHERRMAVRLAPPSLGDHPPDHSGRSLGDDDLIILSTDAPSSTRVQTATSTQRARRGRGSSTWTCGNCRGSPFASTGRRSRPFPVAGSITSSPARWAGRRTPTTTAPASRFAAIASLARVRTRTSSLRTWPPSVARRMARRRSCSRDGT